MGTFMLMKSESNNIMGTCSDHLRHWGPCLQKQQNEVPECWSKGASPPPMSFISHTHIHTTKEPCETLEVIYYYMSFNR